MALNVDLEWEVRTTGNDANGGAFDQFSGTPGTDYSQQDAAQIAFTDLVIGATTTKLSSVAHPFTSAHVGNVINITGGTGFTLGRYQVMSVAAGVATMDRAVGTAASSGGTGNLGGALATIAAAFAAMGAGNTVWVQAGTYTLTTGLTAAVAFQWRGYATVHGDRSTRPLVTSATDSVNVVNFTGVATGVRWIDNIDFTHTAVVRGKGIITNGSGNAAVVTDCSFDGFDVAVGGGTQALTSLLFSVAIMNSVTSAVSQLLASMVDCYINGAGSYGVRITSSGQTLIARTVIVGASSYAIHVNLPTVLHAVNLTIASCANGLYFGLNTSGVGKLITQNCIFYNIPGVAIEFPNLTHPSNRVSLLNNAFGSNGTDINMTVENRDPITITSDPFTDAAGGDFSIADAALKAAGFPGAFPGGTMTGYLDVGAVQSGAPLTPTPKPHGWIG